VQECDNDSPFERALQGNLDVTCFVDLLLCDTKLPGATVVVQCAEKFADYLNHCFHS